MEQKTKSSAALQITALRTESSDTVRHSWLLMWILNNLDALIAVLIPVAYAVAAVLLRLPAAVETAVIGMVMLLIGMVLQSFLTMGHAVVLLRTAEGKDVHFRDAAARTGEAGRSIALLVLGLIMLCASLVPGAAVASLGWSLAGVWKIVVVASGAVIALALLMVMLLSSCLALFVMAEDEACGAAAAVIRSARLMKGHKRQLVQALLPSILLLIGLTAAMALLLWPLVVKRDFLTDTLMIAGGVAYVIAAVYIFMRAQAMLACLYHTAARE